MSIKGEESGNGLKEIVDDSLENNSGVNNVDANKEIAERLQISLKTVGVHRVHLMDKLKIHNVADLVKYALRKGIISLD